jgi:hypothetical protein
MRQLHPVGWHEKFVASGVYTYYEDGQVRAITDQWTINELPDGMQLIRVDWETKEDYWFELLEVLSDIKDSHRHIQRFDLLAQDVYLPSNQVRASYIFYEDHAEITVRLANELRQQEEIKLPDRYVVYPGTRLLQGFAVKELGDSDSTPIPVYSIYPFFDDPYPFHVFVREGSAVFVKQEDLEISGNTYLTRCYEKSESDWLSRFWLDDYDVLLRSETWIHDSLSGYVELTQYVRRPEPPKS